MASADDVASAQTREKNWNVPVESGLTAFCVAFPSILEPATLTCCSPAPATRALSRHVSHADEMRVQQGNRKAQH